MTRPYYKTYREEKPLSALDTIRQELINVRQSQSNCCDEYGIVHEHLRGHYLDLVKKEMDCRAGILLLEEIEADKQREAQTMLQETYHDSER